MMDAAAARHGGGGDDPSVLPAMGGSAALALAFAMLALLGYAALADLRVAVACVAAGLLGIWALTAFHRPHLAMTASFSMLLIAGTKFRTRDADASLAGALDAQIVMELALFALIGIGVIALWMTRSNDRRPLTGTELAVLSYGALSAASIVWSEAPTLTAVRSLQLLIVGAFSILSVRSIGPGPSMWMLSRAVTIHVVLFAVIAACTPGYQVWESGDRFDDGLRFRWFAVHPIDAATLAGLGAIGLTAAVLFRRAGASVRAFRIGLAVSALVAVMVLTRSRGPILALIPAVGVLWLFKLRPTLRTAALLATAAVATSAIVFASDLRTFVEWLAARDNVVTHAFFRGQTADTLFELNGRVGLWQDLQPVLMDRLAVGYGYQASRAVLLDVAAWAAYAHNAFLQTGLDLGVLGLGIVLWMFAPIVRSAFTRSRDAGVRAAVVALTVFLVLNAMSTESFAAVPHFETLLLFLCALCAAATLDTTTRHASEHA